MKSKKENTKAGVSKKTVSSTKTKSTNTTTNVANTTLKINLANDHIIAKTKGAQMVSDFLDIAAKNTFPFSINKCYEFNKEIFNLILSDTNASGIRIYFGINDQKELCLVFNGIDSLNNDIYIPLDNNLEGILNDKFGVADMGQVCTPTYGGNQRAILQLP